MNAPATAAVLIRDLDSREQIAAFVDAFYAELLEDPLLAPIFLDVAAVDLDVHKPHIVDYWCKLLLGDPGYQRHTMNIHRKLHGKRELTAADFERWVSFFQRTVDAGWQGEKADRARRIARTIADNMQRSFS
ncbi:MAG: group III truncated hemoglobin [Halieaceae bacterium]|nr:group III truncated hemoglobin [Halieaceae bacterium]